jgi:hypothetical protein
MRAREEKGIRQPSQRSSLRQPPEIASLPPKRASPDRIGAISTFRAENYSVFSLIDGVSSARPFARRS